MGDQLVAVVEFDAELVVGEARYDRALGDNVFCLHTNSPEPFALMSIQRLNASEHVFCVVAVSQNRQDMAVVLWPDAVLAKQSGGKRFAVASIDSRFD